MAKTTRAQMVLRLSSLINDFEPLNEYLDQHMKEHFDTMKDSDDYYAIRQMVTDSLLGEVIAGGYVSQD